MRDGANASNSPLVKTLRTLIDAAIRTEVDADSVADAHEHVRAAVELLSEKLMPQSFGIQHSPKGDARVWGNVVIGERNAIAPPLVVIRDDTGRVGTDMTLGAAYEGPAGHVHGGVCALILDHVLGATAHRADSPAFTGTLTVRYLGPTPLGPLRAEAWVELEEGRKTHARGHLLVDGRPTVQAEGIFIRPRSDDDR